MACSGPLHLVVLASQAVSPMEPGRVWECFFNVFFARFFFSGADSLYIIIISGAIHCILFYFQGVHHPFRGRRHTTQAVSPMEPDRVWECVNLGIC